MYMYKNINISGYAHIVIVIHVIIKCNLVHYVPCFVGLSHFYMSMITINT